MNFLFCFFSGQRETRMLNERNELYEFDGFRLDVAERKLERLDGSTGAQLPEKAFQTLVHLVRNSGNLITKDELLAAVWPETAVEENNLGKAVHAIRHRLGEQGREHRYIETVPKHGYRFVAAVRRVENNSRPKAGNEFASHEGDHANERKASRPPSQTAESVDRNRAFGSFAYAFVGLLLVGVVGLGTWVVLSGRGPEAAGNANSSPVAVGPSRASDPEKSPAYDLYVRGKVKVASENPEDTQAAIRLLEQAVAIDPNLAEAHAQLARAYNTMAFKYSAGPESKQFHENAEVSIEKALTLDPNLAEAHFARGLILWSNIKGFPHEQAIQSYKRSLALNPNNDETYHQLSTVYSHIGLLDEADETVKKAIQINPDNTLARYRAGVYISYRGKFDEALALYKTIPRDTTPILVDRTIAEALIQTGKLADAEAIADNYLRRYPHDEGGSFNSVKALILAIKGETREAEELIERAVKIGSGFGHFHHTAYNVASAYAVMKRPEEAVKWLEFAADNGFPNYPYFGVDPNLNNIRTDARFIEFMTKLKQRWERFKSIA
jgi:DNA-binding winged helix-turn-helix (wHTH) protein/tetratricopeptide (TPR) repeat protein